MGQSCFHCVPLNIRSSNKLIRISSKNEINECCELAVLPSFPRVVSEKIANDNESYSSFEYYSYRRKAIRITCVGSAL